MRILQIITLSDLGGAQSVVVNLANKLSEEHEVIVIVGRGDGKMLKMLNHNIKKEQIEFLRRDLSPICDFITLLILIRLYIKYNPDIVHLHSSKIGILGRIVFPKMKSIYTVHGFDSIRIAYRKYLPLEKWLQNRCKAIIGVSHYDRQNLINEGITNNVQCISNGVYQPQGTVSLKGMDEFQKRVLCIARMAKPKRFDLFLSTAQKLPKYAFIWIGNQEEIKGLPNNVFCLGNIPNAGAYNKVVDLFMLASDYEGLPMVILEAMSLGKPIVASNVGGISEIVVNNENGYTVKNISEAFASKIEYILENENIYNKFSNNSLDRFNKDLTVNKMVERYMQVYLS